MIKPFISSELVKIRIIAVLGPSSLPFLLLVYTFVTCISIYAILIQEVAYAKYESVDDLLQLVKTALLEPINYHLKTVKWSIKGNYDHFTGNNKGWGEMTRKRFKTE